MEAKEIYLNKKIKTTSKECIEAIVEMVAMHTGLTAYPEQIKAAKEIHKGNIVDMKTGEGKTLAVFLATLMLVRDGRKVYVITSNDYLSNRDYEYEKDLFKELNKKSIFLSSGIGGCIESYRNADVIFATGQTLIFDYLRGIDADYDVSIIDEIDYILVECANHDFSVSSDELNVIIPTSEFLMCKQVADFMKPVEKKASTKEEEVLFDMQYKADVIVDYSVRNLTITDAGYNILEKLFGSSKRKMMYIEFVIANLLVKFFYHKDEHYIVEDNKIIIIDKNSGRISINGSNDLCIQTAIEAKEGLPLTSKPALANTCSFPVFFSLFKTLTGISGTASYVPYDFEYMYGKAVKKIKEHFPNKRKEIFKYFYTDEDKKAYIKKLVSKKDGPYLVVTDSDARSNEIAKLLKGIKKRNILVLDNRTLAQEKELLKEATQPGTILISSKIVGRGTDITVSEEVKEGLTVIITKRLFSERAERQIIGRTGRNGKPGSCYILTSLDEEIFYFEKEDIKLPDEKHIRKLQGLHEQKEFDIRKHIYIRSKLFFDQDRAIIDILNNFSSYKDMVAFLKKNGGNIKTINQINHLISTGYIYLPAHKSILRKQYDLIRPIFQQQFLRYNDLLSKELYTNDGFNKRGKEYVTQGQNIIEECITMFINIVNPDIERQYNGT